MGVRGLTTYINHNQDVLMKKHYLHDTNLIIDGLSLCSQLYCSLTSFSAFGGDYDKYATFVRTFFKTLRKCNITPYVIFDGCHEKKKLKTVFSRLRSKLIRTSQLDPVTQGSLKIFPFLLRDVFKEVLVELEINFTICEFEADNDIASMARHMNCPVLSYDSDFYIYNVWYIPYNMLEMKSKLVEDNDNKFHAMECKIYEVQVLCKHFGGLKQEVLPLLATLLGNDYVEKKFFKKFFSQLKLQKNRKKSNDQQREIKALFHWLQNETLDSAITKILGRLKKEQRDKVYEIIKNGVEAYNSKYCKSLKYFNITAEDYSPKPEMKKPVLDDIVDTNEIETNSSCDSEEDSIEDDINITPDKNSDIIPGWFAEKIHQNKIPTVYLNLYALHLQLCNPQIEDFTDADSFLCTLPIVRYAFDILTDFSHDYFIYISRENQRYKKIKIDKEYAVPRLLNKSFQELNDDELKMCFKHFINIKLPNFDETVMDVLPPNFHLIMISILWWISTCSVPAAHVHCIIMSYLILEVIDEKTGTARGHFHFNNKHSKKLAELKQKLPSNQTFEDLFLNKNKVQYEDCLIAASVLLNHFEIDVSIQKRPKSFDRKKIHSFAQFQGILHQINSLNILCGCPFQTTVYSKSYNGTFIYNIALKLEKQDDPMIFLENYIKGATTVIQFYKGIIVIYNRLKEKMNLSTVVWSKRKKSRWGKKKEEFSFANETFASDVII